jgi:2-polyprenyl-3-methyl-5-hydroxy-6-metoxy-1,4-benzoquinol methylase
VERLIAIGYGLTYDAIVRGFAPYEALLAEIAGLVKRAATPGSPTATRVLDVSCGTGTLAARLARDGWTVVGIDSVAHLVEVGRRHHSDSGLSLSFHHADAAHDPIPGAGTYDVLVSMHTLYWHPDPKGLLAACRRALRPGGHAVFLTYTRPARVVATFAEVRRQRGWWEALRSLRWLVPTALFELFRRVTRRYLGKAEFQRALRDAGFDVLETRETFLAGISLLAWTRTDAGPATPSA